MPIEMRTYAGDAAELVRFTRSIWQGTYQGHMPIPLWDEAYFDWQLLAERPGGRDYLVAAYDGTRLIGCLLGEEFRFRLRGREFPATMGSWLTVDPDYRGHGLGRQLVAEQRRRHQERGAVFHLGFGYLGRGFSHGPKFWTRFPGETVVLGKTGWWVRVLDHRATAAWDLNAFDRWGTRLLSLIQGPPRPLAKPHGIRPYRAEDLPACLKLVHGLLDRVDLGYVWTADRLAHQLSYRDLPRTLVCEQEGQVAGFVNYYCLGFLGRHAARVGLIDLMPLGTMPLGAGRDLLRAALVDMRRQGCAFVLALRLPTWDAWPLLAAGFVPLPDEFLFLCYQVDPSISLKGARGLHVHFR